MPRLFTFLIASLMFAPLVSFAEDAAEAKTAEPQSSPLFESPDSDSLDIPPELEQIASQKPGDPLPDVSETKRVRSKSILPYEDSAKGSSTKSTKRLKKAPRSGIPTLPPNLKLPEGVPGRPPSLPPGLRSPAETASDSANNGKPGSNAAAQPNSDLKITSLALPEMNMGDTVGNLDFSDMAVNDLLDMLQNLTGKAILRQSTISGTFTFKSQGQLTRRQAVEAIVSLLALNGVAVSPLGNLYLKAVPATAAANNAPVLIEDSTLDYEPSQEVCSKLFHIDFMAVPEAVAALSGCQSGLVGTSVLPFEKNASVLATDSITNLQRMETLLARVDKPSSDNRKILFFPLKNVSARDAMSRCQQLLAGTMAARFQGNSSVDCDERTNELIAYTHPANEAILRQLVENLDRDVEPLTRTEIFSIRHADATDLCDVIKEVITGQKQVRNETTTTKSGTGAQANKQQAGQQNQSPVRAQQTAQAQSVVDNTGTQFSNYISIVPDERSNNIVATGTQSDIKLLREIVDKLDAVLPQVRIEVIIVDVTLSKGQSSGLSSFGVDLSKTAQTITPTGNNSILGTTSIASSTVLSMDNLTFASVFNVAKTNSNVKVLSAPCIVTTHNREASITVGNKVPVVSSYSTSTSSDEDNATSISYEDIALELTVKPLIGSNGVVQMEVTQKYNEVGTYVTIGDYSQPEVITREATSFVSVADGKMVVLGGLQKTTKKKIRDKLYILGDTLGYIPVLGGLFKPSEDELERDDLLIFIRPVILNNPNETNADAQKVLASMEASKDVNNYLENGRFEESAKNKSDASDKSDDSKSNNISRHKGK